jgi:hypothetical protein
VALAGYPCVEQTSRDKALRGLPPSQSQGRGVGHSASSASAAWVSWKATAGFYSHSPGSRMVRAGLGSSTSSSSAKSSWLRLGSLIRMACMIERVVSSASTQLAASMWFQGGDLLPMASMIGWFPKSHLLSNKELERTRSTHLAVGPRRSIQCCACTLAESMAHSGGIGGDLVP